MQYHITTELLGGMNTQVLEERDDDGNVLNRYTVIDVVAILKATGIEPLLRLPPTT